MARMMSISRAVPPNAPPIPAFALADRPPASGVTAGLPGLAVGVAETSGAGLPVASSTVAVAVEVSVTVESTVTVVRAPG